MVTGAERESQTMLEFLNDNFLHQSAAEPIRENNILGLVIVSQDDLIHNVAVGEHLDILRSYSSTCRNKPKVFESRT